MSLTIHDVRSVQFDRPGLGRRGYAERDVDRFLDAVIDALAGRQPLTPAEVRDVQFGRPLLRGGYDERQVDEFLDRVAAQLAPVALERYEVLDAEVVATDHDSAGQGPASHDGADHDIADEPFRSQATVRPPHGWFGGTHDAR